MEFDWKGYLDLAERLSAESDEASHRSAVSRAYYYVYHLALNRAERNDYKPTYEFGSHKDMWLVYDRSPVPECKQLANIGERMRRRRVDADYRKRFPRLGEALEDVLADAQKFADLLFKVNPHHPSQASQRR